MSKLLNFNNYKMKSRKSIFNLIYIYLYNKKLKTYKRNKGDEIRKQG